MKIVFMGTPQFAADILDYLLRRSRHDIIKVFTKPDQIRGRGSITTPCAVKKLASEKGIPVFDGDINNDTEFADELIRLKPDVICVVAFGKILKKEILEIPKYCCVNVHGSQLPKYRGPAPFQWSILNGERHAYACIMKMDEGMDSGPFVGTVNVEIGNKYLSEIQKEISIPAARHLEWALNNIEEGKIKWIDQEKIYAPEAPMLHKKFLNFSKDDSAEYAERKVRASDSSHPSKCIISNRSVTILRASTSRDNVDLKVSEVAFIKDNLYLGFKDGLLKIEELKPDGKNSMDGKAFALGIQNGDYSWKEL